MCAEIITVRKRSCGKVMFLHQSVCHSVHRGVSASVHAGIHTPGRHTPLVDTPWEDTPQADTPPGWKSPHPFPQADTPPEQTPRADTPMPSACWDTHTPPLPSACWDRYGYCCERYASYRMLTCCKKPSPDGSIAFIFVFAVSVNKPEDALRCA